jgi:hypothetical protein
MRKLLPLTLMFIAVLPALAKDDETKIKAVVEDRYKEWIAAASKKDAEVLTDPDCVEEAEGRFVEDLPLHV